MIYRLARINMFEELNTYYEKIGNTMNHSIDDKWSHALYHVFFGDHFIESFAEYFSLSEQAYRSFNSLPTRDLIIELRKKHIELGKDPWGAIHFRLEPDGKFKVDLNYEDCNDKGFYDNPDKLFEFSTELINRCLQPGKSKPKD